MCIFMESRKTFFYFTSFSWFGCRTFFCCFLLFSSPFSSPPIHREENICFKTFLCLSIIANIAENVHDMPSRWWWWCWKSILSTVQHHDATTLSSYSEKKIFLKKEIKNKIKRSQWLAKKNLLIKIVEFQWLQHTSIK